MKRAEVQSLRKTVKKREREANEFLEQCFAASPKTSSYTFCTNDVTDLKALGGGKSEATVYRGLYQGKAAILKLYAPRDKNKIFQMRDKTTEEKADMYRGRTIGDSSLTFIRSVRDIYLSILLKDVQLRGEPLTATLFTYGIQEDLSLYAIFSDLKKGEGYSELLKYDYKDRSVLSNLRLLRRILQALQVFNRSIVYKSNSIGCHRDFHPGNCFLKETQGGDFLIKFIDFDLSITNRAELTDDKECDRKTMSGNFLKKQLKQWNKTLGEYTNKLIPQKSIFYGTVGEDDADLYMFSVYVSAFLERTKALANIKVAIAQTGRKLRSDKDAFIELLIYLLDAEVRKATYQGGRLKY